MTADVITKWEHILFWDLIPNCGGQDKISWKHYDIISFYRNSTTHYDALHTISYIILFTPPNHNDYP